jgi:hypothetical protein
MFGLFKSSVTPTQLASGICESFLEPVQSQLQFFCKEAKLSEADDYGPEESALVFFIGMRAIFSANLKRDIKSEILTAYAAQMGSVICAKHPEKRVEFFQNRLKDYTHRFSDESSMTLPMDGVIDCFLSALGVAKNKQGALRITLNLQLLSQLTTIVELLNDINSKFKIK